MIFERKNNCRGFESENTVFSLNIVGVLYTFNDIYMLFSSAYAHNHVQTMYRSITFPPIDITQSVNALF